MTTPQILYAEDDPATREYVVKRFQKDEIKVVATKDGKKALDLFKSNPKSFGLVITDYQMPEMDGYELFLSVKKISPHTPVIMFTGGSIEAAKREKFDYFIQKPNLVNLRQVTMEVLRLNA